MRSIWRTLSGDCSKIGGHLSAVGLMGEDRLHVENLTGEEGLIVENLAREGALRGVASMFTGGMNCVIFLLLCPKRTNGARNKQ